MFYENAVAENREQALDTLCKRLYSEGKINDIKAFKAAVIKRESEMSTELAPNLFIPHAKDKSVLSPAVASMNTKDGARVFLIASNSDEGHIKALAELASAFSEDINI